MVRKCYLPILVICVLSFGNSVHAQYKRVTISGNSGIVQNFSDNTVTVTYPGYWWSFLQYFFLCQAGPYDMGYYLWGPGQSTPMTMNFSFAHPVKYIRFDVVYVHENDSMSFAIDGNFYNLMSSNLSVYPGACNLPLAITDNGLLKGTPGFSPYTSTAHTGARVQIKHPPGITTMNTTYLGTVDNNGFSGVKFSFYFGSIEAGNNGPLCPGADLQLNGDSSITEPGSFYWTGPNGYTSYQQHPLISDLSATDTGIYTLTYVSGTDTLTDTTHVTILPGPDQPLITASVNPICKGEPLQLSATGSPGAVLLWQGPNGLITPGAAVTVPNMQEQHEGKYVVTASLFTCSLSDTIYITVNHPALHSFADSACSNEGYDFNGRRLTSSGTYTDSFTAANGCDSVSQLQLIVLPSPDINIITDAAGELCMGDTISLSAQGGDKYNWYGTAGNLASGPNIQANLPELQNKIMLTGIGLNNCPDTVHVVIAAEICCQVSIPSAFSPNGDGKNDRFGALSADALKGYRMQVYNRFGQLVFVSYNPNSKWNGTFNGVPADIGVYFYTFSCECYQGDQLEKKGDVTLIR
jgi:gliding motility-associated-like protein